MAKMTLTFSESRVDDKFSSHFFTLLMSRKLRPTFSPCLLYELDENRVLNETFTLSTKLNNFETCTNSSKLGKVCC